MKERTKVQGKIKEINNQNNTIGCQVIPKPDTERWDLDLHTKQVGSAKKEGKEKKPKNS